MTIPIALFMGFYMRVLRPGAVVETSIIGVGLLLLANRCWRLGLGVQLGRGVHPFADGTRLVSGDLRLPASVLPVWMLLAPRDYLSIRGSAPSRFLR